jgi:hypothetical protein
MTLVSTASSADHGGRVQHMVIEREIVGRDDIGAKIALTLPRRFPQIGCGGEQRISVGLRRPMTFERGLQFAFGSDTR